MRGLYGYNMVQSISGENQCFHRLQFSVMAVPAVLFTLASGDRRYNAVFMRCILFSVISGGILVLLQCARDEHSRQRIMKLMSPHKHHANTAITPANTAMTPVSFTCVILFDIIV